MICIRRLLYPYFQLVFLLFVSLSCVVFLSSTYVQIYSSGIRFPASLYFFLLFLVLILLSTYISSFVAGPSRIVLFHLLLSFPSFSFFFCLLPRLHSWPEIRNNRTLQGTHTTLWITLFTIHTLYSLHPTRSKWEPKAVFLNTIIGKAEARVKNEYPHTQGVSLLSTIIVTTSSIIHRTFSYFGQNHCYNV